MNRMEELQAYRQRLLARYAAQPEDLRRYLQVLAPEALHRPLEPGGWTPHQVAVHLRDAEVHALAPRIHRLCTEKEPFLENWDEAAWMRERYDPQEPLEAVLASFARARAEAYGLVRDLSGEAWSRRGRHPLRGWRTLQWWVEYAVAHTEEHLRQLGAA